MNCLIVDDDEMSRATIEHYVNQTEFLNLVGVCSNAIEASNVLKKENVDVLFLDVEMPEMSGLELLDAMSNGPKVILITSKEEYAVQAFEYSVTDYLLKPIDYVRFLKAVNKIKGVSGDVVTSDDKEIFVKSDLKFVKINFDEIEFVEAMADYVVINLASNRHIIHSTMKAIEKKLSEKQFVRVHRSYIVNLKRINAVENSSIVMGEKRVPIGASYKNEFMNKLKIL